MQFNRREFLTSTLIGGILLACNKTIQSTDHTPHIKKAINEIHSTISKLAFCTNIDSERVQGFKQINKCVYTSNEVIFDLDKLALNNQSVGINIYDECNPKNRTYTFKSETPTFGFGLVDQSFSERGYPQRNFIENFIIQISYPFVSIFTNSGFTYQINFNNSSFSFIYTKIESHDSHCIVYSHQTQAFEFNQSSPIQISNFDFYNDTLQSI